MSSRDLAVALFSWAFYTGGRRYLEHQILVCTVRVSGRLTHVTSGPLSCDVLLSSLQVYTDVHYVHTYCGLNTQFRCLATVLCFFYVLVSCARDHIGEETNFELLSR